MTSAGKWGIVFFGEVVRREFRSLPDDMRAFFHRICALIKDVGLENVGMPYVRHLEGGLWEMRLRGKGGIARAVYVAQRGDRLVVLRVFMKKTPKTSRAELEICRKRQKELQDEEENQR
jgi:phage-related protein